MCVNRLVAHEEDYDVPTESASWPKKPTKKAGWRLGKSAEATRRPIYSRKGCS